MKRIILIVIMALSVLFSIGDYQFTKQLSYNRYLEGEYFFREEAKTIPVIDPDSWFDNQATADRVMSLDFSDTKTMLLYSNSQEVYACNPHDGICTVIYGSQIVEDFPVNHLHFENDDAEYFYGRKKYTYDEYISYVKSLSKEQLVSTRVSSKKMADFIKAKEFLFIILALNAVFGLCIFLMLKRGMDSLLNVFLVLWTIFDVVFEIIGVCIYNF